MSQYDVSRALIQHLVNLSLLGILRYGYLPQPDNTAKVVLSQYDIFSNITH